MTGGEWVPCTVGILRGVWLGLDEHQRKELEDVVARHPTIFRHFQKLDYNRLEKEEALHLEKDIHDPWGVIWNYAVPGLVGQVVHNPLARDEDFDSYQPPDVWVGLTADGWASRFGLPGDWDEIRRGIEAQRARGELTIGGGYGNELFERLHFLRGYEQFMVDLALEPPQLPRLIEMVTQVNMRLIEKYLSIGVDVMLFADDLGAENAPMMSPKTLRKWLMPAYSKMMQPCRQAGVHVYFHSDGHILELIDSLIESGVSIINPEDLCNDIDNLVEQVKGRICISLDVDRQTIAFGTRQEIHELVEEEVRKLGSPRGGLMLTAEVDPPTPPENVDAVCCAMEEFRTYWWDGCASAASQSLSRKSTSSGASP